MMLSNLLIVLVKIAIAQMPMAGMLLVANAASYYGMDNKGIGLALAFAGVAGVISNLAAFIHLWSITNGEQRSNNKLKI